MKLYEHEDHESYIEAQEAKNKRKINLVWVKPHEILEISKKIKEYVPKAEFGICHGVRNGWEVAELRRLLDINVIGTDIASSATNFDNVIQWDFHNIKKDWMADVDFIYSNSFDHTWNPELCLDMWMYCIKGDGVCFIHWMDTNTDTIDSADCFAASLEEYRMLINKKYRIVEELGNPHRVVFVIKHKE